MRKLNRKVATALLVVASIGVGAHPASAEPSAWGYVDPPVVAHPGDTVGWGAGPVTRWEAYRAGGSLVPLVRAGDACSASPINSVTVIDSRGRVQSTQDPVNRHRVTINASVRTGNYWLRTICTQGETTPELVVVCARFLIDPDRARFGGDDPGGFISRPLVSDRCPPLGAGRSLAGPSFLTLRPLVFFPSVGPGASTTSTTATTSAPGSGPGTPGGGGGGGGGGIPDTLEPDVTLVDATAKGCEVSVTASVLDNVGVTSATVSWSGGPGSGGPMAMGGGGSTWTAVIPASAVSAGGTLLVTVVARDAAGLEADGFDYIDLPVCAKP